MDEIWIDAFANSIIFAFVQALDRPTSQRILGAVSGTILCLLWHKLLRIDWQWLNARVGIARRFTWTPLGGNANPFVAMSTPEGMEIGRKVYRSAMYVIVLFYFLYAAVYVQIASVYIIHSWIPIKMWVVKIMTQLIWLHC